MKKYFSGKPIMFVICLLCSVGMLFLNSPLAVSATGNPDSLLGQGGRTGVTDTQTNINEPGASDNPDELRELNVANNLTVTYNNGNGDIAGPIRILIMLTMIALAPMLLIMLTAFTRIIIVLHFTRTALNTQTLYFYFLYYTLCTSAPDKRVKANICDRNNDKAELLPQKWRFSPLPRRCVIAS